MMAAICGGGAILGVFLHFSIILIGERKPMRKALRYSSVSSSRPCLGAYLGIPLAWLLGVFGSRAAERTGAR